jgi:ubiquinol-cytochrome c reductase iron-sulfur subunit
MADTATPSSTPADGGTRRDFLDLVAWSTLAVGAGALAWPLIDQMNPSADVLALSSIEVDLSQIDVGQAVTVKWRGKPVFIRHRTPENIAEAEAVPLNALRDPQTDAERVQKPEWLVVLGVCTHLVCVPLGNKSGEPKGDFDGWFCPCHGSHYDSAGRIRKGPAPLNLPVPEYAFLTDTSVRIG